MRVWRAAVLLGLAGLAFAGAAAGGGKAAWFVAGAMIGLAAVGLVAGFSLGGGITVERALPGQPLRGGDVLQVEGTANLSFRFPLVFVLIADEWLNVRTGRAVKGGSLLVPMGRRRVSFSYQIGGLDRGVYRLVRTETNAVDFFDLAGFRGRMHAPGTAVSDGPDGRRKDRKNGTGGNGAKSGHKPGLRDGGSAGERPKGFAEEPARIVVGPVPAVLPDTEGDAANRRDFAAVGGVRPYAEGDPVGRVDWRSSMRAGRLMVKTPDAEEGRDDCVLVDPGGNADDFERALGAAAAFFRMREGEIARGGNQDRDAFLPGEDGAWLSLLKEGGTAIQRRLALMERGSAGPAAGVPRDSQMVLTTGRMDFVFADTALQWAGAGPVRVLAALGGPPGEAERRAAGRLEEAGIEVVFASMPGTGFGRNAGAGSRVKEKRMAI